MVNDDEESYSKKDDGVSGLMGEAIKKLVSTGISAAFMTEEAIRSRVSDMKLPKETLNILLTGASKSKDELMNRVSNEVIRIINKIDFVKEASRFVEEHKFRITAEVEVLKKDGVSEAKTSSFSVAPTKPRERHDKTGNQDDV